MRHVVAPIKYHLIIPENSGITGKDIFLYALLEGRETLTSVEQPLTERYSADCLIPFSFSLFSF